MTTPRRIAVATCGRSDYGLLVPLLRLLDADPELDLQIIATGMHLQPNQGETWRQIEQDGFTIAEKVDLRQQGDTPVAIAHALGNGVAATSDALHRLKPDILVLLGDRFEILAVAIAAMLAHVPVAHIHGGEATEGLIDEPIRHSITKMSHIHFTSTETYRRRVIQLGEHPDRVFCVGALGIDNIRSLKLLGRDQLEQELGFKFRTPTFVITYHPVTLEPESSKRHVVALLNALDAFPNAGIVITLPNSDTDNDIIRRRFQDYAKASHGRAVCFAALGTLRYLSVLSQCTVMIGNSSSGLIEAPSLNLPVVDIGDRQRGRIAPPSVIRCAADSQAVREAIHRAVEPEFRRNLHSLSNPYGDGHAAPRIVAALRNVSLSDSLIKKSFYDWPDEMEAE